jgi:hypothetical protein
MNWSDINWVELIGQCFGIAAFAIAFLAYQAKTSKKLLIVQTGAILCFCIHYALLGAMTGFALNVVCLVRNIIFSNRDKKIFSSKLWPYVLGLVIIMIGIFTWESWYSILLIIALSVNTVCMSLPTSQGIRISLLVTCPLAFVYNIFVFSVGGLVNESLSIISSVIGIVRYHRGEKNKKTVDQ